MKRIVKIAIFVSGIIGVTGYFLFEHFMSKPLYEPGKISVNAGINLIPPDQGSCKNYWQVDNDVRLHYFSKGEGRNVLMIHGGPGIPTAHPYPGLDPLIASHRFLYYDQRGCGRSTKPVNQFSSSNYYENMKYLDKTLGLSSQIADIERIRRIIGEEKLILIGHSFGAFLATLYAVEFPEHLDAMVLIAPANMLVLPQKEQNLFDEIKVLLPSQMISEYDDYLERYFDFATIFEKDEAYLMELNGQLTKYYQAALATKGVQIPIGPKTTNGGWMVQAMYLSMGKKHDYRSALGAISAPVLVVHGADDFMQKEKVGKIYAENIKDATFETINNAGHFPFIDQPEAFSVLVEKFLASI